MGLQAQQIVSLACQIAKCPGYTSQAGQFLNNVLQSLAQDYDLDVIRKTATGTFNTSTTGYSYAAGAGPNPLPSDCLRVHRNGAFYYINNVPYTMIGTTQEEFDTFVQQAGVASYPSRFYVDVAVSPMNMYVWQPAAGAYPWTVRYNPQMPDITTPESSTEVPWFPNTQLLIDMVAGLLMGITGDQRREAGQSYSEDAIDMRLAKYLKMKDDPETGIKRVTLDRSMFGNTAWSNLPNTKTVGWLVLLSMSVGSTLWQSLGGLPWI